ncbi:MAG: glutamate-1-semialdehyde 2,1-aminomutase [Chloroflexi bacterium]|nr:glutamate-1-semialdehyde 2,1-aminomutase [Chloroflexota bacterium]MDA1226345.1 glutamate-1-semialdehyde 2,1-aminomutase [Chloroflexota bacterium]
MSRERSAELYANARKFIPGGVNSPARSWGGVGGDPIFLKKGSGSHVWDVDGNEYIDYVCSWGPLILGHAHPEVLAAIKAAADDGTSFGAPTEMETHIAKMVVDGYPSIDMVRFVSSGTEATMSALRLARAFTGRPKIIKFQGGYHGHTDALLVAAGSGAMAHGIPDSAGVTESFAQDTLLAQYNDLPSVQAHFDAFPEDIACLIAEPIAGNMGVVPPQSGFLEGLRDITAKHGALLILDEVITGFRVGYGGAQERYGVSADITCLGKVIGGGMPVGAYGGRQDIMETVAPLGPMYQAGTLSGNPVAMAAGTKMLELLRRPGVYEELEAKGKRLADGMQQVFADAEVPLRINRVGSMMTLFFNANEVTGWDSVTSSDRDGFSKFFHRMLDEGVYLPPSPFEAMFVSTAHTDADIDATIDAARRALA